MAPAKKPGRAKGTKVVMCVCGRRLVGTMNQQVTCPGCRKAVLIKPPKRKGPRTLVFLSFDRK